MRALALLLLMICASPAFALTGRPEVVLVIIDDVSTQRVATYGETDALLTPAPTPKLDAMAAAGQRYLNFSAQTMCSSSRRDIWYGMNPFRHGAGRALGTNEGTQVGVPWAQRLSLAWSMRAAGWQVEMVGKHHINDAPPFTHIGSNVTNGAAMGFDFMDAYMETNPSSPQNHYSWLETNTSTGATSTNTTYTTDAITTAAVARLQDSSDMSPLFLTVSYSAAHTPFNAPPGDECADPAPAQDPTCYLPAITYVDTSMQDIIDELDLLNEDILIYISENGSPSTFATEHCLAGDGKTFATPCGTRVPMVIQGVGVTAHAAGVPALVNIADLHDTLLDIAGAPQYGADSISFRDCFANPSTCSERTIGSAVGFRPAGLPIAPYDSGVFERYTMHLLIVGGTTLYGLNRTYTDNTVGAFTDVLYDLGSPSTIVETKRYGPDAQIIASPSAGEQQDALDAMVTEATRLIESRWTGPPNRIVGSKMIGVDP